MASFDRSKFQKTSLSVVDSMTKKAEATMPKFGNAWTNFLTIEDGKNIFRILPAIKGSAYVAMKTSKMDCEVPVYNKDGDKTGTEVKSKNIYCADVHGADILKGQDPIVSYIKYVKELAEDIQDKEERERFLSPVTGYMTKKGWVWGIDPMLAYVCFVGQDDEVFKLQLRPNWMKEMKNTSIEQSEDDTLSVDIFSDPDAGYPLCINKYKDEKKKQKYDISAILPKKSQSWDEFFEETMVSDKLADKLAALPSLEENYCNVYKKKDWDMALDGLQRFDEANKFNIFSNEEFLNELEQMAALVPDNEEEEEKPSKEKRPSRQEKPVQKAPSTKKAPVEEDKPSYPPLIKLKAFLKDFIETEYEGSEILPEGLTVTELRDWYDLSNAGEPLPFDNYREESEEDDDTPFEETTDNDSPVEEETAAEEAPEDKLAGAKARLAAMAAKRGKK